MAIELADARSLSDDVLDALRLRAIRGRELGYSEADLAILLGVAAETVCRWWVAYSTGGIEALPQERLGRPRGSGAALSEEHATQIQQIIDTKSPEEAGIAAPLWNRRAVRELIQKQCGVTLAIRTVGKYLRRWGYTPKKPRRHARQQDPEEVRVWLEQTYPSLKKRAKKEKATIHWCDETGIVADQFLGTGYAKMGQPVSVEVPEPHIRINMVSSITNEGTLRFMTYPGTMTGALFLVFLERLLRTTTGKIFLIVDRLKAHQDDDVKAWVARHADRLELFELPRRAPERNPDEYLNNDLKQVVNDKGLSNSKSELRSRIQHVMRTLIPLHVISYFLNPYVQYAAASS